MSILFVSSLQCKLGFRKDCDFREEKNTLSFPITPLNIDPLLLNMTEFTAVSQPNLELKLADIADKDVWVSKFRSLAADLEDVARQKAILAHKHKWSDNQKTFRNRRNLCSIHGIPFPTLI